MTHTLYFDAGDEIVACECHALSHHLNCIKELVLTGTRHSLNVAQRVLNTRNKSGKQLGKVYFHPGGHQFKGCACGYRREENEADLILKSRDSRIIWEPSQFWDVINRAPFETPMIPEWSDTIYTALKGAYVKPLLGLEPAGEYVDLSLSHSKLDSVIKGLVKRRVLTF